MVGIDRYTLSVVLFFITVAIVLYVDRGKLEIKKFLGIPILFMRRTKRFMSIIDGIAQASPLFWKAFGTLGVIAGLVFMLYGVYFLSATGFAVASGLITKPAIQLILPSLSATGAEGPGYILIPFWFWLITIGIILIPHEFMHGVIARAEKIKLKSVGLLLLAVLPGAFVEPDERHLKRAKFWTRIRIFAAGSFANVLVAALVFSATTAYVWPSSVGDGIVIGSIAEGSPAALAGLIEGSTISEINEKTAKASYDEYISGKGYFFDEVGKVNPGDEIKLVAGGKAYSATLAEKEGAAYLGITYKPVYNVGEVSFLQTIQLLTMIWLFSLAVGIVNILPLGPLDGGLFFGAISEKLFGKDSAQITKVTSLIVLGLILFSFLGPVVINFLQNIPAY